MHTRRVFIPLAASLLLSQSVWAADIAQPTTPWLNLRSGPGTQYRIVGHLTDQDRVNVLQRSADWLKVRLNNGTEGWIAADYAKLTHVPDPQVARVTTAVLNVRSGPGTGYAVIGRVRAGTTMPLLARANGWLKVQTSANDVGWISAAYASVQTAAAPTEGVRVAQAAQVQHGVVATDLLNLRSGPGTSSEIVAQLRQGTELTIDRSQNGWYRVLAAGREGWVAAAYVKLTEAPAPATPAPPKAAQPVTATQAVAATAVLARWAPEARAAVAAQLARGQALPVLGANADWVALQLQGATVWVERRYLTLNGTPGAAPSPQNVPAYRGKVQDPTSPSPAASLPAFWPSLPLPAASALGTVTVSTPLFDAPAFGASQQLFLPAGTQLTVIRNQGGWLQVVSPDGALGWIMAGAVQLQPLPADDQTASPLPLSAVAVASAGLRLFPRDEYSVDAILAPGPVEVLAQARGWLKVARGEAAGWAPGTAFRIVTDANAAAPLAVTTAPGSWRIDAAPTGLTAATADLVSSGGTVSLAPRTAVRVTGSDGAKLQVITDQGAVGTLLPSQVVVTQRPALGSVVLTADTPNTLTLTATGNWGRPATLYEDPATRQLRLTWPSLGVAPLKLPIRMQQVSDLRLDDSGVTLDLTGPQAYQVLQNDGQKLVLRLAPVLTRWNLQQLPGRDRLILDVAGDVTPQVSEGNGTLTVRLPNTRLAVAAPQLAGRFFQAFAARQEGNDVLLSFATRSAYGIKPGPGKLAIDVMAPGLAGKTIMLDPGHGGSDPGATAVTGLQEDAVNWVVATNLARLLEAQGARVILTRRATADDPLGVSLYDRVAVANRLQPDLFLSIHHNSMGYADAAQGMETYYAEEAYNGAEGKRLAEAIQADLTQALGRQDRFVASEPFYVIRYTEAPAALVELGYLSNDAEARILATYSVQLQEAAELAKVIGHFFDAR